MGKVTCMQQGKLFIKCKHCGYQWITNVLINQEIDDTCKICEATNQETIILSTGANK